MKRFDHLDSFIIIQQFWLRPIGRDSKHNWSTGRNCILMAVMETKPRTKSIESIKKETSESHPIAPKATKDEVELLKDVSL